MKIVKRQSVFETNSSSTHTVSFLTKSSDEPWRKEEDIPEEEREIRSPKDKYFFLVGLMNETMLEDPSIVEELPNLDRSWKEGILRAKEVFLAVLCETAGLDRATVEKELAEAEHEYRHDGGTICNIYFNMETLCSCHCEYCYLNKLEEIIGNCMASEQEMREKAIAFYDPNCYFLLKEGWFGGIWVLEQKVF